MWENALAHFPSLPTHNTHIWSSDYVWEGALAHFPSLPMHRPTTTSPAGIMHYTHIWSSDHVVCPYMVISIPTSAPAHTGPELAPTCTRCPSFDMHRQYPSPNPHKPWPSPNTHRPCRHHALYPYMVIWPRVMPIYGHIRSYTYRPRHSPNAHKPCPGLALTRAPHTGQRWQYPWHRAVGFNGQKCLKKGQD